MTGGAIIAQMRLILQKLLMKDSLKGSLKTQERNVGQALDDYLRTQPKTFLHFLRSEPGRRALEFGQD